MSADSEEQAPVKKATASSKTVPFRLRIDRILFESL